MTYEKDIPDFALVPAKAPEERIITTLTQNAVYSAINVAHVTENVKAGIMIEEDILVPDTRPDLQEILMMDGKVRMNHRDAEQGGRSDSAYISGDIELSTLYIPVKTEQGHGLIPIQNRILFKEPWFQTEPAEGEVCLEGKIEKLEYLVVNERKFRVKILLSVTASENKAVEIDLFEGLENEEIEMLKEPLEVTCVALRKRDTMTIKETFLPNDGEPMPETILKQDITMAEYQRQVAAEKMVINGYLSMCLLYASEDGLHHLKERVEFTQFIPLGKSGTWSGSRVTFDCSDLRAKVGITEEGESAVIMEGELITWIELYQNISREINVDCYHKEKDFLCDMEEIPCKRLVASFAGENGIREVVTLDGRIEPETILYVKSDVAELSCKAEEGRISAEGYLRVKMLCQGSLDEEESVIVACEEKIPYRCLINVTSLKGWEKIKCRAYVKDAWVERLSGRQVEVNATILITGEAMEDVPVKVLKNPAFEYGEGMKQGKAMVIYIVKAGDDLWKIGKKYKATRDSICHVNELGDKEPAVGQKLLILR